MLALLLLLSVVGCRAPVEGSAEVPLEVPVDAATEAASDDSPIGPTGVPGAPPSAVGEALPEGEASQALIPEPVAREKLARWLTDPTAVAQPGELARRPAWESMGRRAQTPPPRRWTRPKLWEQHELPAGPKVWHLSNLVDDERWADAETVARTRLATDPEDPQTRALLGWILTELDRMGEAEAALMDLLQDYPGYVDGWVELGILRSNDRRLDESLAAFDKALDLREGWEARLGRGIALCRADRFREAEYDLWKAVEADPNDGNAYYDLGWIAAQKGDGAQAAYLLRFAARSPRLLAVRICRDVLLDDTYFRPVWRDPEFLRWLSRMPTHCLVPERISPLTLSVPE